MLSIATDNYLTQLQSSGIPVVQAALNFLPGGAENWLWDNVEDLDLLQCFLPSTRSGAILFTTRLRVLGTLARGLDLLPMEQEEGMVFLLRRAKVFCPEATCEEVRCLRESKPTEYAVASDLVTALGGLPLALDQAGAYLEETGCSLQDYLQIYHQHRYELLARRGKQARGYPDSVATTWACPA